MKIIAFFGLIALAIIVIAAGTFGWTIWKSINEEKKQIKDHTPPNNTN